MIVLGDISGIQNYLFDVAEEGGGQAQRLRARSFFIQLLAETASLRVSRKLKWTIDSILLSGAGKFLLKGPDVADASKLIADEQRIIDEWLLRETRAELRLSLSWANAELDSSSYSQAQEQLQDRKLRPWAPVSGGSWSTSQFLLEPLDTPCSLCHHAPAEVPETDRDTQQVRLVCRMCHSNRELGRKLPRAELLIIREISTPGDFDLLGLRVCIANESQIVVDSNVLAVANLHDPEIRPTWCPPEKFLKRRLIAHVPDDENGTPVWFTDLARRAQGDQLLGVLKADADYLGVRFQELFESGGLEALRELSERLDSFFAGRLKRELAESHDERWQSIYTIFAGGDDLIMVGPWNIMIEFAGEMQKWFTEEFGSQQLTLSAGLALIKPKRPIKFAANEAERLIHKAKGNGRNRIAAFDQVWKWEHHDYILSVAKKLVEWVNSGEIERGWLHTLLELVLARHGDPPDPLATARLAYHVNRNWRKPEARRWADDLVKRFENADDDTILLVPAVLRYALTGTRRPNERE